MSSQSVTKRIASVVRAELKAHGVTQQQVANHLRVDQTAVSRRLTGKVPFDIDEIYQIARFLGVLPSSLAFPNEDT